MRKAFSQSPGLPGFAQSKTYASHRTWSGSTTEEVRFVPLAKKEAVRLYHRARDFERQTRQRVESLYSRNFSRQNGRVTRCGLLVLHTLLFDCLNYRTGRIDPSYETIAKKAAISTRSVARAISALKSAGILNWVRRVGGQMVDGHFELEQLTNAYGVSPASCWKGYRAPPDIPKPDPASWGKTQPSSWAPDTAAGPKHAQFLLEAAGGTGDRLAAELAKLGRARGRTS